jgi:hypothetical protein
MTEAHVRPATYTRFSERIRDRYRGRRGFLRSRALRVHRRPVRLAAAAIERGRPGGPITRRQFVLQIHLRTLAWPPGIGRHGTSPDGKRRETLLMLGGLSTPSHTPFSQVNQRLVTSPVGGRAIASPPIAPTARTIAGRFTGASESLRERVPGLLAPPRSSGPPQTTPSKPPALVGRSGALHEPGRAANVPVRAIRTVDAVVVRRPLVHAARPPSPDVAGVRYHAPRTGPSLVQRDNASPLYSRPAMRSFAMPPDVPSPHDAPPVPRAAQSRPPEVRIPLPPPPLDLERLTEDVYHHLQRRMRIERERRGL